MVLGKETLVVNSCVGGEQAEALGVQPGWRCRRVGAVAVASLKEFMVAVQEERKDAGAARKVGQVLLFLFIGSLLDTQSSLLCSSLPWP